MLALILKLNDYLTSRLKFLTPLGMNSLFFFHSHPRICLSILEREEERERNTDVREASIGCLPYVPAPGIEPVT